MLLTTIVPAATLETILNRLSRVVLTGAGGDTDIARQAASEMLAAYCPHTHEEVYHAANIISFGFQALQALSQAAEPEVSLTHVLRLRGGAVTLAREAEKSRRALSQLQKTRQVTKPVAQPQPAEPAEPSEHPEPAERPEPAEQPEAALPAITRSHAYASSRAPTEEDRQRDQRIAAGLIRMEARLAAQANATPNGIPANAGAVVPAAPPATSSSPDPEPDRTPVLNEAGLRT